MVASPHVSLALQNMADVEKEFIEFLKSEKIVYNRIVAHYRNNNISPEIVGAYYQAHHGKLAIK